MSERDWRTSSLANGWFCLAHPVAWAVAHGEAYTTIEDPEGVASLGIVLALQGEANLEAFSEFCFAPQAPYQAVSEKIPVEGPGWAEGVFQDFLDPTSADPEDTTRRILCVRRNDLYAKVTFYCHQSWLGSPEYTRIVESIRVEGMRVVGAP